jgi:hypothetical protein
VDVEGRDALWSWRRGDVNCAAPSLEHTFDSIPTASATTIHIYQHSFAILRSIDDECRHADDALASLRGSISSLVSTGARLLPLSRRDLLLTLLLSPLVGNVVAHVTASHRARYGVVDKVTSNTTGQSAVQEPFASAKVVIVSQSPTNITKVFISALLIPPF